MVTTLERAPRGGHTMLWGFGYETLALYLGYEPHQMGALRQAVHTGRLDPTSFDSIFEFKARRDRRRQRKETHSR